jgi:hypothetical protein
MFVWVYHDVNSEITLLYLKSCRGQLGINATVKQYHGMKAQYKYGNVQTQIVIVCVMSACFRYKYGMVKSPLSSIPMSASQRSLIFLFVWNNMMGLALCRFWNIIKIWIFEEKRKKKYKVRQFSLKYILH